MSKLKTVARVSFVVELDELNKQRKLNGHPPLDDATFFSLVGGRAMITMINEKHISETIETKLSYIVR